MCDLCDESEDGSMQSCQDCGVLICFDVESDDDVVQRAYVTQSGDLFCHHCGVQHDINEEANDDIQQEIAMDEGGIP